MARRFGRRTDRGGSIGEALDDEPGIANRSFGPGSSRPIVRRFGGDRVHTIEDGIPTGDLSSTSDHHGVTIDPSSAERIEITRGPATLLYGSNIVGLINVITPHAAYRNLLTPPESYGDTLLDGTRGRLGTDATSASRQVGTYANVRHSRGHLLYWGSGAYWQAGDYATPEGSVFNSATELSNARAGLGYFGDRFFTSLSLTKEDSRFGLPYEDRFHAHGDGDEHDHEVDGDEHDEVGEKYVPMPPDPRERHFLAAPALCARPVVHRVQPDERALSKPHLVHQGLGPGDGSRGCGWATRYGSFKIPGLAIPESGRGCARNQPCIRETADPRPRSSPGSDPATAPVPASGRKAGSASR